ncbi:hypothetical protein ACWDPV_14100 [Gordonia sp. NPDC003504]
MHKISRWIDAIQCPTVNGGDLLVIRSPGDEATGLLTVTQFFLWVTRVATSVADSKYLLVIPAAAYFLPFIFFNDIEGISNLLLVALSALIVLYAIPLLIATLFVMTASLAFGGDGPFSSLFSLLSAETTPPGDVQLVQIPSERQAANSLDSEPRRKWQLVHSKIYNDPSVIDRIVAQTIEWREFEGE